MFPHTGYGCCNITPIYEGTCICTIDMFITESCVLIARAQAMLYLQPSREWYHDLPSLLSLLLPTCRID